MSTEQKTAHRYSPHPIGHYIRNIKGETSGYFKYPEAWNLAWLSHDWEKGCPEDAAGLHQRVMDTVNFGHAKLEPYEPNGGEKEKIPLPEDVGMERKMGALFWCPTVEGCMAFMRLVIKQYQKYPLPIYSEEWVKTIEHRAKHHCLQDATAQSLMDNADQPITGQAEKLAQMALDKIMGKPA